ncbi:hypothetical protein XENORESO_015864 [Xenotaenia resolanae]|uniref:Uncharacterized protein n=1 Tax=Xenotaenia resolanae TaxID=208358 RepID=A0ABV0WH55_9TELE
MTEHPGNEQLANKAADFQAAAETYYNIAVEKVKDAVSLLPDDMRPGPDLYGIPWEPVIFTGLVGLVTFLLFTCRCYRSIKSRLYQSKFSLQKPCSFLNNPSVLLSTGPCYGWR